MGDAKTMKELAGIFNVSQPRISQWKKAGMPVESDGTYDPVRIQRWRVLRLNEKVETLLPAEIENGDSQQGVSEIINGLGRFRELVDGFKRDRGDILCGLEGKLVSVTEDLLDSVTKTQILQMPLRDRLRLIKDFVSSITSLYTSERLERGESTDNVVLIVSAIKDLKKKMRAEREAVEQAREASLKETQTAP